MTIDQILGSPGQIANGRLVWINPKLAVEGRQYLAKVNGSFDDLSAQAVSLANDLPGPQSSARQEGAADLRPMVTPGACWVKASCPSSLPLESTARRMRSMPDNNLRRSLSRSALTPASVRSVWPSPLGRNAEWAGPRKPGWPGDP